MNWLLPKTVFCHQNQGSALFTTASLYGDRLDNPLACTFLAVSPSIPLLRSSLGASGPAFSRKCGDLIAARPRSNILDLHGVGHRIRDEGFHVGRNTSTGDAKAARMVRRSLVGPLGTGGHARAQLAGSASKVAGAGTALESQPPVSRTRELPDPYACCWCHEVRCIAMHRLIITWLPLVVPGLPTYRKLTNN